MTTFHFDAGEQSRVESEIEKSRKQKQVLYG